MNLLPENADERRMFDDNAATLGDPLLVIANACKIQACCTSAPGASFYETMFIHHNELVKAHAELESLRAKLREAEEEVAEWKQAASVEARLRREFATQVEGASTRQPIDTAPKDGTHILAWRDPIGIRFTNLTNPPTVVHWFDDPDHPGFYTSVNERAPEHPFNPTHWMPLPAVGSAS